jgi:hypothetical protein
MSRRYKYKQGDFDGLCGVYSILNSVNKIYGLDKPELEKLFKKLLGALQKRYDKKPFASLLIDGTKAPDIRHLLLVTQKHLKAMGYEPFEIYRLYYQIKNKRTAWNILSEFHNDNEHPNNAIILGLDGRFSHWSCIEKMTESTITCRDSAHIKRINKTTITTKAKPTNREYVLDYAYGVRL